MASKDNIKCISLATGKFGIDSKGKYEIYQLQREISCQCHPETCSHINGTVIEIIEYKNYKTS